MTNNDSDVRKKTDMTLQLNNLLDHQIDLHLRTLITIDTHFPIFDDVVFGALNRMIIQTELSEIIRK